MYLLSVTILHDLLLWKMRDATDFVLMSHIIFDSYAQNQSHSAFSRNMMIINGCFSVG